jgi:hypothetical protein
MGYLILLPDKKQAQTFFNIGAQGSSHRNSPGKPNMAVISKERHSMVDNSIRDSIHVLQRFSSLK